MQIPDLLPFLFLFLFFISTMLLVKIAIEDRMREIRVQKKITSPRHAKEGK